MADLTKLIERLKATKRRQEQALADTTKYIESLERADKDKTPTK